MRTEYMDSYKAYLIYLTSDRRGSISFDRKIWIVCRPRIVLVGWKSICWFRGATKMVGGPKDGETKEGEESSEEGPRSTSFFLPVGVPFKEIRVAPRLSRLRWQGSITLRMTWNWTCYVLEIVNRELFTSPSGDVEHCCPSGMYGGRQREYYCHPAVNLIKEATCVSMF